MDIEPRGAGEFARGGRPRAASAVVWVLLAAALGGAVLGGPARAAAQQPGVPPSVTVAPGTPTTRAASGRAEDGSIIVNGPQRTGRSEPTLVQRLADTLIWGWLLLALAGGPLVWWWTGRSGRAAAAPDTAAPDTGSPTAGGP